MTAPHVITVDSPLGRWTAASWRPADLTDDVVELWYFEGAVALLRERTFPTASGLGRTAFAEAFGAQSMRRPNGRRTTAAPTPLFFRCLTPPRTSSPA